MRCFGLSIAAATAVSIAAGATYAADLKIPPRALPKEVSVHTGPPNCSRWTDDCVNCARDGASTAPVCSNIGFACQPKPVRCLSPSPPAEPGRK